MYGANEFADATTKPVGLLHTLGHSELHRSSECRLLAAKQVVVVVVEDR